MVTILFWNLDENATTLPHLRCLTERHGVDVLLLAEAPANLDPVLTELNALGKGRYREPDLVPVKVRVLTRLPARDFSPKFTGTGRDMTIWAIRSGTITPPEVLLAVVHLPSKAGGKTATAQASVAVEVAGEIAEYEDRRRHRNTVLVGDFNMSPFDSGMTLVTGFHGLMTRSLAERPDRDHRGMSYRRFYNPMWGLFGDRTPGPAGTHFWRSSEIENHHWAMLDQVLVRAGMVDRLKELAVLSDDGIHDLAGADGAPDRQHLSDHLPVLFKLDI